MNTRFFDFTDLSNECNGTLLGQVLKFYHLIINSDDVICHVSPSFAQFITINSNELVGRKFSELLPLTTNDFFSSVIIDHDSESQIQQVIRCGDDIPRLVKLTLRALTIATAEFKVVTHFAIVEQDYLQGERQLFEQSGIAEFIISADKLEVIAANHCAQALCGINDAGLTSMLFSDLCDISGNQLQLQFKQLEINLEDSLHIEFVVASGKLRFVELKVNPVLLDNEMFLHIQVINLSTQKEQIVKIQHAESLKDAFFNSLTNPSLMMDSFGRVEKINPEMAEILGQSCSQLIDQRARDILPAKLATLVPAMSYSSDPQTLNINNEVVKINFIQQPIRDSNNQSLGLLLSIEPPNFKQLSLPLKALEVANSMSIFAVFTMDTQGIFTYVNQAYEKQSSYKSQQLIGQSLSLLIDQSTELINLDKILKIVKQQKIWRGTLKHLSQLGANYWIDLSLKPMLNQLGDIESYVGVCVDVTQQKELKRAGAYLANYDMATGLANSILGKDRLEGMIGRANRHKLLVGVVYLDISKIIVFTQDLGLIQSNEILVIYCQMIKQALRSEDALVRMSPNRLAVLLPDLPNITALEVVVAKIDKVNNQRIASEDQVYDLDVRQGVSYYPEECTEADSLFLNAESSLQRAWHSNERVGCFGDQQNDLAVQKYNLRRDIVNALTNQELEVLYQPILDIKTSEVAAIETNLQWRHQAHGLINGDDLYAIAEASSVMNDLGLWLFEQACLDLVRWREQGHQQMMLALNLSHGQLRDKAIARKFSEILERHQLPASLIALELPLSYIATQWLDLESILEELSLMGFELQYDRFGERGAYISDLRNFPFRGLKISAEYISQLEDDPGAANLVLAIISMAKALNMQVTAVGVDRLGQMLQLQEMGCNYIQGNYSLAYSPCDEIDNFLIQEQGYQQLSWE